MTTTVTPLPDDVSARIVSRSQTLLESLDELAPEDPFVQDATDRLRAALSHPDAGQTMTLVVVGEPNSGKSTLVNGLIGESGLSPVGAASATRLSLVFRFHSEERVVVYQEFAEPLTISRSELSRWALESAGDETRSAISIEVGVQGELFERGLVLVDTPGVGGLDALHTSVTRRAIEEGADALLFCTRADRVLGAIELEFLVEASATIGVGALVVTHVDLFENDWQAVLDSNRQSLEALSSILGNWPVFPIRGRDLQVADETDDPELARRLRERNGSRELTSFLEAALGAHRMHVPVRNALRAAESSIVGLAGRIPISAEAADHEVANLLSAAEAALAAVQSREPVAARIVDLKKELFTTLIDEIEFSLAELPGETERMLSDGITDATYDEFNARLADVARNVQTRLHDGCAQFFREAVAELGIEDRVWESRGTIRFRVMPRSESGGDGAAVSIDSSDLRNAAIPAGFLAAPAGYVANAAGSSLGTALGVGAAAGGAALMLPVILIAGAYFTVVSRRKRAEGASIKDFREWARQGISYATRALPRALNEAIQSMTTAMNDELKELRTLRLAELGRRRDELKEIVRSQIEDREQLAEAVESRRAKAKLVREQVLSVIAELDAYSRGNA